MSWLDVALGLGPASMIVSGAVLAVIVRHDLQTVSLQLTTAYAAAMLTFMAGVRRGLSFRSERFPTLPKLATTFLYFGLALAALAGVVLDHLQVAASALTIGFAAAMIADPIAATGGDAPFFFRRLRPPQMIVAIIGTTALWLIAGR